MLYALYDRLRKWLRLDVGEDDKGGTDGAVGIKGIAPFVWIGVVELAEIARLSIWVVLIGIVGGNGIDIYYFK